MVFTIYLTIIKWGYLLFLNLSFFTYKKLTPLVLFILIGLEELTQNDLVENNDHVRRGKPLQTKLVEINNLKYHKLFCNN